MNKATLTGNLTKDPELRRTTNGISVCSFVIAVNTGFKEKRRTDFLQITTWDKQAESCAKYLRKGSKVLVHGEIHNRTYETRTGEKRTVTDIAAGEVEFLDARHKDDAPADMEEVDAFAEELPF